jgi:ubiquinone biosynthesis protein
MTMLPPMARCRTPSSRTPPGRPAAGRAAEPAVRGRPQRPGALHDALLELLTRPDDIDEQQLERALGRFMARHLAGGAATAEMFTDLFRLASRFELSIPPEVATVLRALGTLEGTLSLYQFIGYNLLIVAAILALRVLFTILRSW